MPEAYIVRFKVLTLECAALSNGQQYTIAYRRGETSQSTPCYTADGGVVDFSVMPEGSAIVHFKTGGMRFQPKWITFRVEEYVRDQPRKTVGETQIDCASVLGMNNITAATTRRANFDMYGTPAVMVVALLLYPIGSPPLSFTGLLQASPNSKGGESRRLRAASGEVKKLTRGEALTLLISLEAMLERRRAAGGSSTPEESPLQRRVAELEERRRCITGVEGMATTVVTKRVVDLVEAQFIALSRKYRGNYVGELAAYLRQMAVTSGIPLTADISAGAVPDAEASQERLQRINDRIATVMEQTRKLEDERESLTRLQGRTDVTNEMCAILTKVETLQCQVQLLIKSRVALEDALRGNGFKDTPIGQEVQEIRARIKSLTGEEEQLQGRIRRMMAVAATHVLKWARSKNPPTEGSQNDFSALFAPIAKEKDVQKDLTAGQRQEIIEALSNVAKSSTPPLYSQTSGEVKDSAKDVKMGMFGAKGLPSMDDFAASASKPSRVTDQNEGSLSPTNKHVDPYIQDLGKDMFAPNSAEEEQKNKKDKPVKNHEFSFGSAPEDESDTDDANGDRYGTFGGSMPWVSPETNDAPPAVQVTSIDDDFMYDFRPTETDSGGNKAILFEFDDSSFSRAMEQITAMGTPAYGALTEVKTAHDSDDSSPRVLPTYNFGSDDPSNANESRTVSRMPTYNFGS